MGPSAVPKAPTTSNEPKDSLLFDDLLSAGPPSLASNTFSSNQLFSGTFFLFDISMYLKILCRALMCKEKKKLFANFKNSIGNYGTIYNYVTAI